MSYKLDWININATDCPARVTNNHTGEIKEYGVEGDAWRLLAYHNNGTYRNEQDLLNIVFNNFKSDIKINNEESMAF